jgi:hypothetical protein
MAAAHCPGCGKPGEPGACENCGAEIPTTDELPKIAGTRRQALAALIERANELRRSFAIEPRRGGKITGDQLAGAIMESGILERLDEANLACQRLSGFDFDNEAELGSSLRKAATRELDLCEEVRDICLELAGFEVSPPQPEVRGELIDAGKRIAEMLLSFLETVSAQTILEVREGEERLQAAINRASLHRDFSDRVAELQGTADLDARISLAVGRQGSYLDDQGFPSPGLIFGAFAGQEEPYERLAEATASYFGHLLPGEVEPALGSTLILAAVNMASIDRPLRAHRCVAAMAELVCEAAAQDSDAVGIVIGRSVEEGAKLFAAAARVRGGMRLISRASELEEVEEELLLREVMSAYLEIAESALRSYAWAVLGLEAVLEGKAVSEEVPPTLGSLEQRLRASGSKLARILSEAADPELRNAAAHAQYRWDVEASEVEDLQTGQRWSVEELEERTEALGDAVVGVDAGYLCGIAAAGLEVGAQRGGVDPRIRTLLLEAAFAVAGYELVQLDSDGATATVCAKPEASLPALMTAVASQSALVKEAEAYRVLDGDGVELINVSAERMWAATTGPEAIRDLEIVRCFTDSEIRTGAPASIAARESLAVQSKVVAVTTMRALAFEGATTPVVARIRRRAESVLEFLVAHPEIEGKAAQAARRRFERLVAATYPLQRGDSKALRQFLSAVQAAFAWADQQDVSWPPELDRAAPSGFSTGP